MASFDPLSAAIGGALIGLAAVMLMLANGRIAGVSGIFGEMIAFTGSAERWWRVAFVIGLIGYPVLLSLSGSPLAAPAMPSSWLVIAAGGLLVGFGTRMGGGCTSGHGVCGTARLSPRSITATVTFMVVAMITVFITRHVIGA